VRSVRPITVKSEKTVRVLRAVPGILDTKRIYSRVDVLLKPAELVRFVDIVVRPFRMGRSYHHKGDSVSFLSIDSRLPVFLEACFKMTAALCPPGTAMPLHRASLVLALNCNKGES